MAFDFKKRNANFENDFMDEETGLEPRTPSGFQRQPQRRPIQNEDGFRDDDYDEYPPERRQRRVTRRRNERGGFRPSFDIPWGLVCTIIAIVGVIAFCWTYRDAISAFLAQVLSWVFVIVIIFLILRSLLFGGRRW